MQKSFALSSSEKIRPLAEILRPKDLAQVVGQEHLLGENSPLAFALKTNNIQSMILWGPPGSGKTTIARLIAQKINAKFYAISAVNSGVNELKTILKSAKDAHDMGLTSILLVDEIHRYNKAQQDIFLPYIEEGSIILIAATTENPSFELNAALLSRAKVFIIKRLDGDNLLKLVERAEEHYKKELPLTLKAKNLLCKIADGDGRYLLGLCEQLQSYSSDKIYDEKELLNLLHERAPIYDKNSDAHYNLISALHKSLRGSDVDAALYWFARMLSGGEDPMYIVRRLVRFAVEDIGLADPQALVQAINAKEAYKLLGSPEGELAISQCVIYLATAPKSNANYIAYNFALKAAKNTGSLNPPKHILNAPTKLMKDEGYGEGYQYDHDLKDGFSGQNYFPDNMSRVNFYSPVKRGFERDIEKRLEYFNNLRQKRK